MFVKDGDGENDGLLHKKKNSTHGLITFQINPSAIQTLMNWRWEDRNYFSEIHLNFWGPPVNNKNHVSHFI